MRDGNPGEPAAATAELMPGHDLERHAGARERERFLAATAEHERVAAFQTDDALAAAWRRERAAG